MGKTISGLHLFVWSYVIWRDFAETVTYFIVTILVAPRPTQAVIQPSQEAPPPTSGVYSNNAAVVAEYGMFVHIIIVTTVN